ncbi:TonB-dependent receptor [Chitinophaga sp. Cy-1792]|uniref:TonB-dependent receptor n=1 Tax=Chitinophaga sp. Cy-1792 TaxID=2608339 RepID=UPI0014244EAD|nr:TonB-dependent receptor [Chitinophaga sp. Cy-1792]NIG52067.1 TonB-dependent receptor [Chitinophaga sp. Cy-1792]
MKILLATIILFASLPGMAQDTTHSRQLSEVTVTASKVPMKASETGKVLTILTRQYLDKNNGKTVADILNTQPGLVINGANNTPGSVQTVYMRGAGSGNTLILIDGMPVSDASQISGAFDLNFISTQEIERIEILRGAQSTLYGSDAVAGVINIITRKAGDKKFGATASLGYGSYNDKQAGINLHGHLDKFSYILGYKFEKTDGFSDATDTTGHANFDKDGFRQHTVFAKLGLEAGKRWNLQYLFNFSDYHHALDEGAFIDDRDYNGQFQYMLNTFSSTYKFKLGEWRLLYSYQQNKRHYLNDSGYIAPTGYTKYDDSHFSSYTHQVESYVNLDFTRQVRVIGGGVFMASRTGQDDYLIGNYPGATPYITNIPKDSAHANQVSAYASVLLRNMGGFNLDVGGRYNHHQLYGNNFTYSINPSYLLNDQHKFYVNVASGYKTPTLYQLYAPGYGNSGLSPEVTTSYEAGYQLYLHRANFRVTGFWRDTRDLIIFYSDPVTYAGQYRNANKQQASGLEAEFEVEIIRGLDFTANYSYTDGHITETATNGSKNTFYNLYRIPRNMGNATLGYQITSSLYASASYKYVGLRYDVSNPLGDYYTVDLYGEYKFGNLLKIFAGFRNITDYKYFDVTGYNSRGFNFNTGVIFNL